MLKMHPQISISRMNSWICSILIAAHAQSLPLAMLEMHPQMSISHMNQWIFLNTHCKHTIIFASNAQDVSSNINRSNESMDSLLLIVKRKWSTCFFGKPEK